MKTIALLLFSTVLMSLNSTAQAQEVYSGDTLRVRFSNWSGLGFAPEASVGRIDSRSWIVNGLSDGAMDFGDTKNGGDFGRGLSTGRVTTGGLYAFTPAADVRLLGFQPTGTDLAPGLATLKIRIDNEIATSSVGVSYDMWTYNDQGRSTIIELAWSKDGVNFFPSIDGGTMTPAAAEVGVQWEKQTVSGMIPTGEINEGGYLFLRWSMKDGAGTGSRDEWGLEEIRVFVASDEEITPPPPPPPPYADKPTVQARNIKLLARSDSSMHVAWDRGNGDFSILAALPDGVTRCETDTSVTYAAHPNIQIAGQTKNGCIVLWSGFGNQAFIFGLQPLQNVSLTALEFNGENGRENYLEDEQEVAIYRARATTPEPIVNFRVQLVTFDEVTFTWDSPEQGYVHVVLSNYVPSLADLLGYLDSEMDVHEITPSGCSFTPCTISRDLIGSKNVIAFTVNGPEGHQSVQHAPFAVWEPLWPDPNVGRLLAEWNFDNESNYPSWSVWEHQQSSVSVAGARDRGYITGHSGKASYADQWNEPNFEKSWNISLTTHGLSHAHIEFRVISSATGPAKFQVVCDVQGQYFTSQHVVDASSSWANSTLQQAELPASCLLHQQVKLLITPLDDIAMNGNPISKSGTSRLDDVRLFGKYEETATPLVGDLQLLANVDDGVTLIGNWISAIGKWPTKQSLKLEFQGQIDQRFYPVSELVNEFQLNGLVPATKYTASHCGYVGDIAACSKPIVFVTPYLPPTLPVITQYLLIEPDSLELSVSSSGADLVVLYAFVGVADPKLVDSSSVDQFDGTAYRYISRTTNSKPIKIGGLRPSSSYRIWAITVVGPDSVARYSKPDHPYVDVLIPRLPEPETPNLVMRLQNKNMDSVTFFVSEPDNSLFLYTITPFGTVPSRPENDVHYYQGQDYGHGERIGDATYVINGPIDTTLTINGLPLGQKWVLRVYAFNSLHGSITYSNSYVEILFETLPDPTVRSMTAAEIWNTANGDTIATSGSVLWISGSDILMHLKGGNMLFYDYDRQISQTKFPIDIAFVAVMSESKIEIIDIKELDDPSNIAHESHVIHPDSSNSSVYGHVYITIGNVLQTRYKCEDGSPMYRQRGKQTRKICLVGQGPLKKMSSFDQEWAVKAHPVYDPLSPYLNVIVTSETDVTPYTPPKPLLISPNKDQLITWTKNDDTEIEFKWEISAAQRPNDHYPDSVAAEAYFLTRKMDRSITNKIKLGASEQSHKFKASELHRTHVMSDSLQLTTELEWAIGIVRIADSIDHELDFSDWVPFSLLRLKALYDTDVMNIPSEFILEPARPNPFNPTTSFRVHLPTAGELDFVVYDILGRRVSTIYSGTMKSGVHDFSWNASRLPSGIYITRARFGDRSLTQTVTLVK